MTSPPPPDEFPFLTHALRAAERTLRDLLAEQLEFPQRVRHAIQLGYHEQIVNIKQRQDELPQCIAGAHVTVLQLQIRLLEIEHRVVADCQRRLQQEVSGDWNAYQVAREQWEEAVQVQQATESRLQTIGQRLNQLKRQLERARAEAGCGQGPRSGGKGADHDGE